MTLPRLWANQKEVKDLLAKTQEEDEQKVLGALAARKENPSVSARMITNWGLGREEVRKILRSVETERILQTTLTNLVGATRFKAVKEGELMHTKCPKCGQIDSWAHCVECYSLVVKPMANEKQWLCNIARLLRTIATESPAMHPAADKKIDIQPQIENTER